MNRDFQKLIIFLTKLSIQNLGCGINEADRHSVLLKHCSLPQFRF